MNILINKEIRKIENDYCLFVKSKIRKKEVIYKIFDDVYSLLFTKNILPYDRELLKSKIIIQDNLEELDYLGKVSFDCDSFFDCHGVDKIYLVFDKDFTTTKIAMTIGHELMHIYFHYVSHLDKKIQDLEFEEGLCELIGFYVGLYIKNKGKKGVLSKDISKMLVKLKNLKGKELDVYEKYNKFFLIAYEELKKYDGSLLGYLELVLEKRELNCEII